VEVNSSTSNQSSPVQSIAIPGTTTPAQALRINGSGGTTGYLANTNDGTLLGFAADNAANSTDLAQTSAASILPRAVATLNASGTLTLPASYTGTTGNQCRGATSLDDSAWYIADKGGIYTNSDTLAAGSWKADIVDQGLIGNGGSPVTATVLKGSVTRRFLHLTIPHRKGQ
jgi:hypothetical protein